LHDSVGPGIDGADRHPAVAQRPVSPPSRRPDGLPLGDRLRFWAAAAIGGTIFFSWSLIGPLLGRWFAPRRRIAFGQRGIQLAFAWMLRTLERFGLMTIDVGTLGTIADEPPVIIVPNHPSMLDAVVVISRVPSVCCVMKRSLLHNVLTGNGARLAGYIDNGSVGGMVRKSVAALQAGCHLLIFAEGTRSDRHPVGQFTRAYALIARKSGIPMQTVLIETDSAYATKGWPLLRPPPLPIRYTVRLGRRFDPADDIDGLVAQMQAYFEAELGKGAARPER
jgi:1-acyl-sn-glycerol-3-phosphate acyltransferase